MCDNTFWRLDSKEKPDKFSSTTNRSKRLDLKSELCHRHANTLIETFFAEVKVHMALRYPTKKNKVNRHEIKNECPQNKYPKEMSRDLKIKQTFLSNFKLCC